MTFLALLCHGVWSKPETGELQLVMSDPHLTFHCLDYRETEGRVQGRFLTPNCLNNNNISSYVNISSTGPCILPLTAGDLTVSSASSASFPLLASWTLSFRLLVV